MQEIISKSVEQTRQAGAELSRKLSPPAVVALIGELGSGKTEFVRGFVASRLGNAQAVSSPTFVLWQQYAAAENLINHLDLYRLNDAAEILELGFLEIFQEKGNITLIEWAEKISDYLPDYTVVVNFTHINEYTRKITIGKITDKRFD